MKSGLCSICILLSFFVSCSNKSGPDEFLIEFINYSVNFPQDKDFLLKNSTGKFHERILGQSFEEHSIENGKENIKIKNLKILNKTCNGNQCNLTYILNFDSLLSDKVIGHTEVKKIADIRQIDGRWKIFDVVNVKTFYHNSNILGAEKE